MKSKGEIMSDAVTGIDEVFVEEAEQHPAKVRRIWVHWAAVAAALVLIVGGGWLALSRGFGGATAGGGSVSGETSYQVYAGPVLPLTARGELEGLTVSREILYDFSGERESLEGSSAKVTDRYLLTNDSGEEKTLTLFYPFTGSLYGRPWEGVHMTADGEPVTPEFRPGPGVDQLSLSGLGWEDFQKLLEESPVRPWEREPCDALEQPALVYTLTQERPGAEEESTVTLRFRVDPKRTGVFIDGDFTSRSWDPETGEVTLEYTICGGLLDQGVVTLIDGDLEDPELEPSEGAGLWRLERRETTLREAAETAASRRLEDSSPAWLELLRTPAGWLLEDWGSPTLENSARQEEEVQGLPAVVVTKWIFLTSPGELYLSAESQSRVMYYSLELTIPAGESRSLEVLQDKHASYDYVESSRRRGDWGYDLLTRAGTTLEFTEQRASVTGLDRVEITDNNYGFDPKAGITDVTLDQEIPCYWMQLRAVDP